MLLVFVIRAHASARLRFSVCVCTTGNCLSIRIPFHFNGCVRIDQLEVKFFAALQVYGSQHLINLKFMFCRDTLSNQARLMAQKLLAINTRNFIITVLVHHSQKMYWLLNFLRNHYGECKNIMWQPSITNSSSSRSVYNIYTACCKNTVNHIVA